MPTNRGINNAQNVLMDQNDHAIAAHTKGETFKALNSQQSVDAPAVLVGQYTNLMWFGPYYSPTGYNVTNHDTVQAGLQACAFYLYHSSGQLQPSASGPNGEQVYNVSLTSPWDMSIPWKPPVGVAYVVNTAAGVQPGDAISLLSKPTLADFDYKLEVTATGPSFLQPYNAVFDLDPTSTAYNGHNWIKEGDPSVHFGGGDFSLSYNRVTPAVIARVAEGFVSLYELTGGLPFATLDAPGNIFDIKLVGFHAGSTQIETFTHDKIVIAGPQSAT